MKFETRILQWRNPVRISLQSFSLLFRKQPGGGLYLEYQKIYITPTHVNIYTQSL